MSDTFHAIYDDVYGGGITVYFTPPTVDVRWDTGERLTTLFSKQARGITVLRSGTTFTEKRFPSQVALREADAYYLGGHGPYVVDETEAEYLYDGGYTLTIVEDA